MTETTTLLCELCETPMTAQGPSGSTVRYYFCAGCGRWVASTYGDDLVRARTARVDKPEQRRATTTDDFDRIKERLTRWIAELDESDPFQTLGLPPSAPEETVRARFHELALRHHPDRGGDAAQMRRVIAAYDRIRNGKRASAHEVVVDATAARKYRAR